MGKGSTCGGDASFVSWVVVRLCSEEETLSDFSHTGREVARSIRKHRFTDSWCRDSLICSSRVDAAALMRKEARFGVLPVSVGC